MTLGPSWSAGGCWLTSTSPSGTRRPLIPATEPCSVTGSVLLSLRTAPTRRQDSEARIGSFGPLGSHGALRGPRLRRRRQLPRSPSDRADPVVRHLPAPLRRPRPAADAA